MSLERAADLDHMDIVIIRLLYRGLGDAAIGRRLGIGHRTVQRRVQRVMDRWNVVGRVALGARAQQLGLLGGPVPRSARTPGS
ncbi:helix-turn-helix domain-containing protein [Streptomyces sp. NPDC050528]|uniref:helix-turn-helix domain-containing protein n=1 Tax=unclassified Streptomyces TaxID=2593676 RepID=UPI00378D960C